MGYGELYRPVSHSLNQPHVSISMSQVHRAFSSRRNDTRLPEAPRCAPTQSQPVPVAVLQLQSPHPAPPLTHPVSVGPGGRAPDPVPSPSPPPLTHPVSVGPGGRAPAPVPSPGRPCSHHSRWRHPRRRSASRIAAAHETHRGEGHGLNEIFTESASTCQRSRVVLVYRAECNELLSQLSKIPRPRAKRSGITVHTSPTGIARHPITT